MICGSNSAHSLRFSDIRAGRRSYDVGVCPNCGLGITFPFPDREDLNALYSTEQYRDHKARFVSPAEKLIRLFRKGRCRRIQEKMPKGRILDVGCARGLFLSLMRESDWEVYGLELNDETAFSARTDLGLDVKTGSLADAHFPESFFDRITIWHVLEHVPEPVATIEECRRILRPGGMLALAIPNLDSLQARISGRHWFHLDIPWHLYHFNAENIKLLLEREDFRISRVRHFSPEFNPFGYLQSFLNLFGIEHNLLYTLLRKKRIRKALLSGARSRALYFHIGATFLLVPFLAPLSLVFSLLEALMKRGGTIEVYAVKKEEYNDATG